MTNSETARTFEGRARDVYRRGKGPGVVVMHEAPGITPEVAAFGRTLADAGFTVFMPTLFGTPGREFGSVYTLESFASICGSVGRSFRLFTIVKMKSPPLRRMSSHSARGFDANT